MCPDAALLSLRSSGHDFCSAVGEVIDNSLVERLRAQRDYEALEMYVIEKVLGK